MNDTRLAVGAPEGSPTVMADGVRLAYSDIGEGTPLVCLHATGHGARDFEGIPTLARGRIHVLAFDWPGHGRSGDDHKPASAARYSELLAKAFEELNIERAIILGNSIGGAASIDFAARYPDRVLGLMLANPGGLLPANAFTSGFCFVMETFFRAGEKKRSWFGPAFGMYYRMVLSRGPIEEHRKRIVAAGYDQAKVLAEAWHSFGQPDADLRDSVADITCPVMIAWARHDRIIQYKQCRAAIERFPNAETTFFNAGHSAFLEDPVAFGETFNQFVDRLGIPGENTANNTFNPKHLNSVSPALTPQNT